MQRSPCNDAPAGSTVMTIDDGYSMAVVSAVNSATDYTCCASCKKCSACWCSEEDFPMRSQAASSRVMVSKAAARDSPNSPALPLSLLAFIISSRHSLLRSKYALLLLSLKAAALMFHTTLLLPIHLFDCLFGSPVSVLWWYIQSANNLGFNLGSTPCSWMSSTLIAGPAFSPCNFHQLQSSPVLFHEAGSDATCRSLQLDVLMLVSYLQDLITLLQPGRPKWTICCVVLQQRYLICKCT